MTGRGRFVEVQGTAESGTFSDAQMGKMLAMAKKGIGKLRMIQKQALQHILIHALLYPLKTILFILQWQTIQTVYQLAPLYLVAVEENWHR